MCKLQLAYKIIIRLNLIVNCLQNGYARDDCMAENSTVIPA
jgi:hypothetical protein